MTSVLVAIGEHGLGRKHPVGDPCVIGRHPDCDLQLIDSQLSKQHARLAVRADRVWVEDLGSLNGVFVNGRRIHEPVALSPNDVLAVGSHAFLFDPSLEVLPEADGDKAVLLLGDEDTAPDAVVALPPDEEKGLDHLPAAFVQDALDALAGPGTADVPLATIMGGLGKLIRYDAAAVLRAEGDRVAEPAYLHSRTRTLSLSRTIANLSLRSRTGVRIPDAVGDTAFRGGESVVGAGLRSVLVAPLWLRSRVIGVVFLTRNRPDFYTDDDLRLLLRAAPLLALAVSQMVQVSRLRRRLAQAAAGLPAPDEMRGGSPSLDRVRRDIDRIGPVASPVLVTGETGSGKELVARWLHEAGGGEGRPFVAVNCGALPSGLIESELFGHEKGAFTGADRRKPGKLELASGGTLFLDEIGDLAPGVQVKLLRALEQKSFYRVGGTRPVEVDFRLVAATHRDLEAMCREGTFRQDLFFRINVLRIEVPPLRERPEDIEELVRHFLGRFGHELGKEVRGLDRKALAMLRSYSWPGNVRELRNIVERCVVLAEGPVLGAELLPAEFHQDGVGTPETGDASLANRIGQLERQMIAEAMRRARGKKVKAAGMLGISRPTLDKKLAQYGIDIFKE